MTSEQALSEREIFRRAVALSARERAVYLDQACGDSAALRREIESLLAAHDEPASFMEQPAFERPAEADGTAAGYQRLHEGPGTQIGPYKLLQEIGAGGMGVVFMAEQTQPVQRKVALKIIKPGMDTRQVIARFEAERQALALMDHANIAKVFDAGATQHGRPYFVMELVQGVPITEYCDQCNLTTRERLELLVSVCQAVQHAHQKGVIHRDIKPTNVLVSMQDGRPAPKIIDFGVAKAINQQLTEHTLTTAFAQIVGTPLYMSPEQAELSPLGVDTRSDIYSLGVLLYELLTGSTPFDKDRLRTVPYDELRRIIREEEPPRPSTRISTLAADPATTVAERRRTDARRLRQTVCGELDWIVMRALDKDRNRRYETANGLARDIERYLHNEPVHACPPSKWYSFRKFVRRNKRVVSTATVLALSMLVAVVTLAVTNVMIREEQSRTKDEKDRAEAAQKLAEHRAEEIRQGLVRLKTANTLLDRGRWYANERRWDDAHAAFTKAIEVRPDHVSLWMERADLYTHLGLWDLAAADYAREIELREPDSTLRWYQHALLRHYVGDTDGYDLACGKMRQRFHGTLSAVFAEEFVRSSLLAPDPNVALPRLVELAQKASAYQPWSSLSGLYVLGVAHYRSGQYDQAIQRLQEGLAAQPQGPTRLLSHPVLAMAYQRLGRAADARQALGAAASVLDQWTRQRYEGQEPVPWWDYLEGQLTYREAKLLIEGSPPPDDPRLHVLRARALAGLPWPEKAVPEYDAALKLSPHDPEIRLEAHRNQGDFLVDRGQWEKAADQFAKACELKPDDSYLWRFRAVAAFASGNRAAYRQACTAMVERFEKTEDRLTAGNVLLSCLLRDDALPDMTRLLPMSRVAEPIFHWGAWARGAALHRAGKYEESIQCFEAAAQTYRPRAWDWCFLAMAHQRLGHYEEARRCSAQAARWIDEASREELDDLTATRPAWGGWHERVVYPILLREAEQVLEQKSQVKEGVTEPNNR